MSGQPDTEAADGRSRRWDDHRAARRAELVRAARRAVHRIGPDVSMEEIAAAAGTSKSIVYRYFVDKTGLQVAVGEAVVAQMHAALDEASSRAATPREGLRSMIDVYLAMVETSPNVYWFVTRPVSEDASAPLGHFLEAVAALVARPFARVLTEDRDDEDGDGADVGAARQADVWAAGAVGFVRGTGDWWLTHRDAPGAPTREELVERITAWLWAGPVSVLARTRTARPAHDDPAHDPADDPTTAENPAAAGLNDEEQP
nr:TetR family transcriptional regulator [Actinotalea sp. JY-7876]